MTVSKKRGYEGIKSAGILPDYRGIIVHDCWTSYWKFNDVTHSVCCAHLLRELNGIAENHPEQAWARKFKEHLLRMKRAKDKAIAAGKDYLSVFTIQKYKREYDVIIKEAYAQNPIAEPVRKKRGRVKRGKILALIDRLKKTQGSSLPVFRKARCSVRQQSSRARYPQHQNKDQGLRLLQKQNRRRGIHGLNVVR